jgi:hypothetical protein
MQEWLKNLEKAVQALLDSVTNDMVANGDILSRDTIRCADEVRLIQSRKQKEA